MKPAALLLPQSQWSHLLPFSFSSTPKHSTSFSCLAPSIAGGGGEPTARERRQLRQEKRESRAGSVNWREEVEERLLHKPKKRSPASWTEDLNLDLLARLGPQWWVVRVSRVTGEEIAQRLARLLARNFPQLEFKVYYPAVREKKKLKNGTYNVKSKPLFAGCVFLHCVLNKDIHDFIRECDGVGGFVGSRVGNTKRQINRPKPVSVDEMEAIFNQAKVEQENTDRAFEEKAKEDNLHSFVDSGGSLELKIEDRKRNRSKKQPSKNGLALTPGTNVRVLSGPFTEFTGCVKELDRKKGKATVGLSLFGKESFVDLEIDQIEVVTA
ncbi:uncharacterized protein [Typha angustifolia]|uniref:uncharacterized protein isoform X1 n=1 Tax=Typha angustifolia TaxID=59011 RepID=UPI003C2C3CCB